MYGFTLVATIAVVIGAVIAILRFERRRARQVERDLRASRNRPPDDE